MPTTAPYAPALRAPKRVGPRAITRRWWVIPLAIAATAAAGYGAAELEQRTYSAESSVVVSSQISESRGPGRAWEANRLAITLATAIPDDDRVLARIAGAIDRPVDEVQDRLGAVNPPDTAVVRLRYRDEDRQVAYRAARTAALAIVGPSSATRAAPPGSIELLQLARRPDDAGNSTALIVALAAALGLGLGLILALALERADPRIDDAGDCIALTGLPTTQLDGLKAPAALAMLERWLELTDGRSPRMAVVPVTRKAAPLAPEVARWLVEIHKGAPEGAGFTNGQVDEAPAAPTEPLPPTNRHGWRPFRGRQEDFRPFNETSPPRVGNRIEIAAGGPPGTESAGEAEALRSDVIALLTVRGVRGRDLAGAVELLAQYGHQPEWILFAASPRRLRKRMRADAGPPVTDDREATERAPAGTAQ